MLATAARAQSGSYTVVGPTGGQTSSTPQPGPPPRNYGPVSGGYGGTVSNGASTPSQSASTTCSGTISQVYTWHGDSPLPVDVIVTQTSTATDGSFTNPGGSPGSPTCDDGLLDTPSVATTVIPVGTPAGVPGTYVNATSTGTHYTVKASGAGFTITCSPQASIVAGYGHCTSSVAYSGVISPVTIRIQGTHDPMHGDYRALTGQQIDATLQGIPGGFTVTSYTWSISPSTYVFKDYDTTAPNSTMPRNSYH